MLWLVFMVLCGSVPAAEVVDRIEVTVQEEVVMTSDVHIDEVISGLDTSPSPLWSTAPDDRLARLVDAALIRVLAGEVAIYQPEPRAVERRLGRMVNEHFADKAEWQGFLDSHGLDEASVAITLKRRLVVERWLNRNLQTDPTDIAAWWAEYGSLMARQRTRARIRFVEARTP